MKRLGIALFYGCLTLAGVIGVATLLWAAQPRGASVLYTATDVVTMPAGTTFSGQVMNALGAFAASGSFTAAQNFALTGVISPAQITANQDNYNPSGLATASVLRLSTSASWNLTGLVGGTTGRLLLLANVGSQNLVLVTESASTLANRFSFPGDLTLIPKAMVMLQYDGTDSRWRTSFPSLTAGPVSASYVDYVIQGVDPSPPGAGILREYAKAGGQHTRDSAGNIVGPFGTGGGGGSATFATVRVATTTNMDLTGTETVDGVSVGAGGELVLVKNQTTAAQNGIYVASTGAWTRSTSFNLSAQFVAGFPVYVQDGTSGTGNKDTVWNFSVVGAFTLGTTSVTFSRTGAGPAGEVLASKSTGAAAVNNGYIGADATGQVPYTRIGSFAQHAALSAASAITVTARQMGIEGSTPVSLSSAIQMVAGVANQEVELIGTHATNTVQLNNGNGLRLCENLGSVVVGLDRAKPIFRYNSTLSVWEQIGCTGREVYGATNLASAWKTCDVPGGLCLNIFGGTIQGTNAGAPVDNVTNIPATKKYQLQYGTTPCETVDTSTGSPVHSYSNLCKPRKPIAFKAMALEPDGVNCTAHAPVTVNGGPKETLFKCAKSNSSIFFGSIPMFDSGWDAGAVRFTLTVYHQTSETITFAGDFSAQCKAPNETVDNTWSSGAAADVAITTANQFPRATTSDVTPIGTCAADDVIFWRYVVDAANFSTNAANTWVYSVTMTYLQATRNGDN